jgi:hypothetical protein
MLQRRAGQQLIEAVSARVVQPRPRRKEKEEKWRGGGSEDEERVRGKNNISPHFSLL